MAGGASDQYFDRRAPANRSYGRRSPVFGGLFLNGNFASVGWADLWDFCNAL
jgi:hypothetical protein